MEQKSCLNCVSLCLIGCSEQALSCLFDYFPTTRWVKPTSPYLMFNLAECCPNYRLELKPTPEKKILTDMWKLDVTHD